MRLLGTHLRTYLLLTTLHCNRLRPASISVAVIASRPAKLSLATGPRTYAYGWRTSRWVGSDRGRARSDGGARPLRDAYHRPPLTSNARTKGICSRPSGPSNASSLAASERTRRERQPTSIAASPEYWISRKMPSSLVAQVLNIYSL
jgi:hypothetical protein